MMKNLLNIKTLLLGLFSLVLVSCSQNEDFEIVRPTNFTKAKLANNKISVTENEQVTFNVVQEKLVEGKIDNWEGSFVYDEPLSGQIGIRVVGGTATLGTDYTFNNYNWDTKEGNFYFMTVQDFSPFLVQDGFIYTYDASKNLENTISNFITIINDGITEGPETIEIALFPVALGYIVINETLTITIND